MDFAHGGGTTAKRVFVPDRKLVLGVHQKTIFVAFEYENFLSDDVKVVAEIEFDEGLCDAILLWMQTRESLIRDIQTLLQ
jgi:hypothetical protein